MTITDTRIDVPRVPWRDFPRYFRWSQGEHIAIIAPTGAGKTTLERKLMPYRSHVIFFGTKIDDPVYRALIRDGFKRIDDIDEIREWDHKYLLWPKFKQTIPEFEWRQRQAFQKAMNTIAKQGRWTLVIDEAKYIAEKLRLRQELTFAFEQLRSIKSTIIAGAQRPASIPISRLTNASHVFMWKSTHDDDAKRLADLGGVDSKMVAQIAKTLDPHEFLYIHTRGTQSRVIRSQVKD